MKFAVFACTLFGLCLINAIAIDNNEILNEVNFELRTGKFDNDSFQIEVDNKVAELLQSMKDALLSLSDINNVLQISKIASIQADELDISNDEPLEIESRGAFSGLYWVTKKALRTLKGVHCTIIYGLDIRDAAQQFNNDVQACGGVVSKQVQAVVGTCNNIITTVDNIINLNEKVCNNTDYNEETDGSKKTGWSCFWKLLKQFVNLKKQIQKALSQVKKIPTTGAEANECVTNATVQLTKTFTAYPSYVKSCSKLTSN